MGPYRTGKSFLLDKLVPHDEGVFPFKVGNTVQPETEEVSMVLVPPCATGAKETVIVLDSPGLFAPNRASIFDAQVLAVLNLLSSVALYNNLNIIDRSSIEKLSFAVETAFTMSYFEQQTTDNAISRPHLIWVIQNFHLAMLGPGGADLSGPKWIESVLEQVDKSNNGTSTFRKEFGNFFASLDVRTLPFPVPAVADLPKLVEIPSDKLDPQYREAVAQLWKHVLSRAAPKEMGGIRMSGAALARLVEKWTDHMNVPIASYRANSAEELLGHIMSAEISRGTVRFAEQLQQAVKPPMSDAAIEAAVKAAMDEIAGPKAAPRFVDALRSAVAPLVAGHRKANEDHIRAALAALAAKHNATAQAAFAAQAAAGQHDVKRDSEGLNAAEVVHLTAFDTDAASLKALAPALHAAARTALSADLISARAAAVGRSAVAAAQQTLDGCTARAVGGAGVDQCLAEAQAAWRAGVAAALGPKWPEAAAGKAAAAAGEPAALAALDGAARRARVKADAVAEFRICRAGGSSIAECAQKAVAGCGADAACVSQMAAEQSAAIDAICEDNAGKVFNWTETLLAAWWTLDPAPPPPGASEADLARPRPAGWLPADRMAGLVFAPLRAGACGERNTTLSRALQDRAFDNIAAIALRRAKVANTVLAAGWVTAGLSMGLILWARLCCTSRKRLSASLRSCKLGALQAAGSMCAVVGGLCLAVLALCPHVALPLDPADWPPHAAKAVTAAASAGWTGHGALGAALLVEAALAAAGYAQVSALAADTPDTLHAL